MRTNFTSLLSCLYVSIARHPTTLRMSCSEMKRSLVSSFPRSHTSMKCFLCFPIIWGINKPKRKWHMMARESALMANLCRIMAEYPFQVHMLHLMICYFCHWGLQVQLFHDKSTLAPPSLARFTHPCWCAWSYVSSSVWNIFALCVKLSFLLVHKCVTTSMCEALSFGPYWQCYLVVGYGVNNMC